MTTSAFLYLHLPFSLMTSDTTLSCASNEGPFSEAPLISDSSYKTGGPLDPLTFGQLTPMLRESALPQVSAFPTKLRKAIYFLFCFRTKMQMTVGRSGGEGPVGSWPYIHRYALPSCHFDVLGSIEQSMQGLLCFQTHRFLL